LVFLLEQRNKPKIFKKQKQTEPSSDYGDGDHQLFVIVARWLSPQHLLLFSMCDLVLVGKAVKVVLFQ
jgi:hypothetical protein